MTTHPVDSPFHSSLYTHVLEMTLPVAFYLRAILILIANIDPVRAREQIRRASKPAAPLIVDKPLLAIQIGSIVGTYVIFVALLLALLIFLGRRLRRSVQSSNYTLHMEMLNPTKRTADMDPGPLSPMPQNLSSPKANGFKPWGSLKRSPRASEVSHNDSVLSIDESIVATDREKAQAEMEMLYAAVMEHDAQKLQRKKDTDSPDSQITDASTVLGSYVSDNSQVPFKPVVEPPSKSRGSSRLSKLFHSGPRERAEPKKVDSPRWDFKFSISSPLPSPGPKSPHVILDKTPKNPPLSPRMYNPGPPPAAPRTPRVMLNQLPEDPPLSPRIYNPGPPPVAPLPRLQAKAPIMPPSGRSRMPAPLNLSPVSPSASSSKSLPFREAYPQQSAPATKTTFLERPSKHRGGPLTGMPTPYSPYMPFTPVTPFTPGRLVTKQQRKREERGNGLHVLKEDDLVKNDEDIWG